MAAGHQRVADDRVAHLEAGHSRTHGLDPAGVLMTHDVRKLDVDLAAPDAFDHVQVSTTHPSTTNAHDDVCGVLYLRVGHVFVAHKRVARERLVVLVQYSSFHQWLR